LQSLRLSSQAPRPYTLSTETSALESAFIYGGGTGKRIYSVASQSKLLKNGCFLMSSVPPAPDPKRLFGFLFSKAISNSLDCILKKLGNLRGPARIFSYS